MAQYQNKGVSVAFTHGFTRFSNKNGYTCIALILFNCDNYLGINFGERVQLKTYPVFTEGQQYIDSLFRIGDIRSPLDLSCCEQYCSGIYPLNEANTDSPCLLCCDSGITVSLVIREIIESKCPINLLIMETHGHSVNHAYSEGLFTADTIIRYFREIELNLNSRFVMIPYGIYTQQLPIQRALPHWKIRVLPPKMADLSDALILENECNP